MPKKKDFSEYAMSATALATNRLSSRTDAKRKPATPQAPAVEEERKPRRPGRAGLTDTGEARSRRVCILTLPSLHDRFVTLSKQTGRSVNNLIEEAMKDYARHNRV